MGTEAAGGGAGRGGGLLAGLRGIVTGAGQGLGRATAAAMAAEGAELVLIDRNAETLAEAAAAIRAAGGAAEAHVLDVTDAPGFAALVAEVAARGRIDVLVNNAGITPPSGPSFRTTTRSGTGRSTSTSARSGAARSSSPPI